jgi:hypothetical protein
MIKTSKLLATGLAGAAILIAIGCESAAPKDMPTEPERQEMFALMLPSEIKIQPFTKIRSFDDDEMPDGILAVIRPLDRFGDPAKAVGTFYFELWTFQKASGDHKGERLAFWERTIVSDQEVKLYWTRAQMYEFQLAWDPGIGTRKPGKKFVLTATYRPPWDQTMQDEYIIDFHVPRELLGKAASE